MTKRVRNWVVVGIIGGLCLLEVSTRNVSVSSTMSVTTEVTSEEEQDFLLKSLDKLLECDMNKIEAIHYEYHTDEEWNEFCSMAEKWLIVAQCEYATEEQLLKVVENFDTAKCWGVTQYEIVTSLPDNKASTDLVLEKAITCEFTCSNTELLELYAASEQSGENTLKAVVKNAVGHFDFDEIDRDLETDEIIEIEKIIMENPRTTPAVMSEFITDSVSPMVAELAIHWMVTKQSKAKILLDSTSSQICDIANELIIENRTNQVDQHKEISDMDTTGGVRRVHTSTHYKTPN